MSSFSKRIFILSNTSLYIFELKTKGILVQFVSSMSTSIFSVFTKNKRNVAIVCTKSPFRKGEGNEHISGVMKLTPYVFFEQIRFEKSLKENRSIALW